MLNLILQFSESFPYEKCEIKLISISDNFTELHVALKNFATYFPTSGARNSYYGITDFDFIGRTLTVGRGEIRGNWYSGILFDNAISDEELQYLRVIRDCAGDMMEAMAPEGDLEQISKISSLYLDEVILEFLGKFDIVNEDNFMRLLFEE